eukprot:NODE_15555_length_1044_cov_2.837514.p3 GENE.NODE_15555_length_1044_cov_2.837514~~NODE_15555_length_1044_cov_2.837514.p3  ORF type:complete len:155 (+),score=37.10 NODE_15555_length_1044_cov_2.837514:158-622(+)
MALLCVGAVAALPIAVCTYRLELKTDRARLARNAVLLIYCSQVPVQAMCMYFLLGVRFVDLPSTYITGIAVVFSIPVLTLSCLCLCCAAMYGQRDLALVLSQREERANAIVERRRTAELFQGATSPLPVSSDVVKAIFDSTQSMQRQYELVLAV